MANDSPPPTSRPWRSAAALGLIALVGAALLAGVYELTRERIAFEERRTIRRQLDELVRGLDYDNLPHADRITVRDDMAFPGGQRVVAYRLRRSDEPQGVILRFAAPDGYNGWIDLLMGIDRTGRITGVRVTGHNETPGLGDAIESAKSDWAEDFTGRSLGDPPVPRWTVRKDGGYFDQFTGATITPRAVVHAVRRALTYFEAHRDTLFRTPAETSEAP